MNYFLTLTLSQQQDLGDVSYCICFKALMSLAVVISDFTNLILLPHVSVCFVPDTSGLSHKGVDGIEASLGNMFNYKEPGSV